MAINDSLLNTLFFITRMESYQLPGVLEQPASKQLQGNFFPLSVLRSNSARDIHVADIYNFLNGDSPLQNDRRATRVREAARGHPARGAAALGAAAGQRHLGAL